MNTRTRALTAGVATTVVLGSVLTMAPAEARGGGDDTVRRGHCSGATTWKVKVGQDDGRLEVEAEVDSNRAGQTWTWRLVHDGSVSAHGSRVTKAPSGSFEVRRLMVNRAGTDTVTLRARNTRTGEVCRGTVHR
jgi:hypothetical protein